MIVRFRHRLMGAHVHVGVYLAASPEGTFSNTGELRMSPAEWACLRRALVRDGGADERPEHRYLDWSIAEET